MASAVERYADRDIDFGSDSIPQPRKAKASPRPRGKTGPGTKRPSSAQKSAPYSSSLTGKTARELWIGAVKQPGGTSSNNLNSFSGLKKAQSANMSYSSTSHYLRQLAGTEKAKKNGYTDSTTPRASTGRPAYRSPEEYYDEIIEMKKEIQGLKKDNSTMKLKARRLEEDNIKKEKQIEQLLDPSKSEDMRRTLGNGKQDTGTVIHSLKQKILKLEHQLKDKEGSYNKLQSDLKTTKIEEMKVQMDSFYREILRLNEVKSVDPGLQKKKQPQIKETPSRLKAMQETVLRMNEKNVKLQAENKSLKQDLDKMMAEMGTTKERQDHYEDMTKKELLSSISKLEKRLDKAEETTSLISDVESRGANVEGKITLEGTMAQRLDQLDKRETELLEEMKKKNSTTKKLKEDRTHYRKKVEEKQKEIKSLKQEIEELQAEIDGFYDKDKAAVTPRGETPRNRRRSTPRTPRKASSASSSSDKQKIENFRQNHAAKTIQHNWRGHQHRNVEKEKEERNMKVQEFSENRAAKRIQRGWIDKKSRERYREEDEATELLQSALRNHKYRQSNMRQWEDEDVEDDTVDDSDMESATSLVQSSLRGYQQNKAFIRDPPKGSRHNNNNRASRLDSEGEELDDDTGSDTNYSRPLKQRTRTPSPRSKYKSRTPSPRNRPPSRGSRGRTPTPASDDDDDESDDDIVMTSGKKFF